MVALWVQRGSKEMTEKEENRYKFFLIKSVHGTEEIVPSVKYILHRHKNASTNYQCPCKNPGMLMCTCNPVLGCPEASESLGFIDQSV